MKLLAIDPGNVQSAWVLFNYGEIETFEIRENSIMLATILGGIDHVAIEYMRPRGMPTSREEMDTMFMAGRLIQWFCSDGTPWTPVYRMDVKLHLCGNVRAKDKNVMQALKDRYGGNACKGTKRNPGPLYGFHDDLWSALAVGLTFLDTRAAVTR